ncbi:MAG: hypothetical protein OXE77_00140 [Flavobacteriaceae bacterium]|nr:hypothetical protein [Flavobacteriaceae bacterium]MCY4266997.1 hypothetical protein [Flavobacteriaceae bacterium]
MGKHKWSRLKNTVTNQLIDIQYGICDRKNNCDASDGKHIKRAYQELLPKNVNNNRYIPTPKLNRPLTYDDPTKRIYIPKTEYAKILNSNILNTKFCQRILETTPEYPPERLQRTLELYHIGSIGEAIVCPYINQHHQIVGAVVKEFGEDNRTLKDPNKRAGNMWLHNPPYNSYINLPEGYKTQQNNLGKFTGGIFIGEHLISQFPDNKNIYIFESWKDGVYYSFENGLPSEDKNHPICLAAGTLATFHPNYFSWLRGKSNYFIRAIPDLKAFDSWKEKADVISQHYGIELSKPIEMFSVKEWGKELHLHKTAEDLDYDYADCQWEEWKMKAEEYWESQKEKERQLSRQKELERAERENDIPF